MGVDYTPAGGLGILVTISEAIMESWEIGSGLYKLIDFGSCYYNDGLEYAVVLEDDRIDYQTPVRLQELKEFVDNHPELEAIGKPGIITELLIS